MSSSHVRRAAALFALLAAGPAFAVESTPLTGSWQGTYICGQGATGLTLTIDRQSGTTFAGTFHFYPVPENPKAKEGCFQITGHFVSATHLFFGASTWITRPENYVTVDLDGQLDPASHTITGKVKMPPQYQKLCSTFDVSLEAQTPAPAAACRHN